MKAAAIDPCDASQYDTSVAEDQRQEPTELVRYSRWIFSWNPSHLWKIRHSFPRNGILFQDEQSVR